MPVLVPVSVLVPVPVLALALSVLSVLVPWLVAVALASVVLLLALLASLWVASCFPRFVFFGEQDMRLPGSPPVAGSDKIRQVVTGADRS